MTCTGTLLASCEGDSRRLFCCAVSPDGRVVTGGENHLKFFTLDAGAEEVRVSQGLLGSFGWYRPGSASAGFGKL